MTDSENRGVRTTSSYRPSSLGDSQDALWSNARNTVAALSRGAIPVARTNPVVEPPSTVARRIRVPSSAGVASASTRRRVVRGSVVDDVASGSAAASAVANSGAPSVAVTSAAPGSTKSAGCAPVFG